ncbi:MAG: pentalenene synthase, partial [Chloroflexi bacterium]|nr:pentalenene synthase [Chloroflexota bacterium]
MRSGILRALAMALVLSALLSPISMPVATAQDGDPTIGAPKPAPGTNAGADARADPGAHTRADPGPDARADAGARPGT